MFYYYAYGLRIRSPIPLPEFLPTDSGCDVVIHLESHDYDYERYLYSSVPGKLWDCQVSREKATLAIKDVGVFLIRQGEKIVIIPAPNVDHRLIRLYLVGTIMAILLYQRSLLVLHASVVEVKGGAVGFMGMSGAGKSSTAAALYKDGHRIIADDVMAVNLARSLITVFPGFPQIKLSLEVADSLGYDRELLVVLHSLEEKRGCQVPSEFPKTPLPLRCVYLLSEATTLEIEPIPAQKSVIELLPHSVPTRWLIPGDASHFFECANLANAIPLYRLKRPRSLLLLPDLARLIEEHLEAQCSKSPCVEGIEF